MGADTGRLMETYDHVELKGEAVLAAEEKMPLSIARAQLPTLVQEAAENGRRVVITRFSRPYAALVPVHDLERLLAIDVEARENMCLAEATDEDELMIDIDDEAAMAEAFPDASAPCLAPTATAALLCQLGERVVELTSDPEVARILDSLKQTSTSRPAVTPAPEQTTKSGTNESCPVG
ncbi:MULTISPECIES: type II toxin-antitoxin system Phd/YefM family antitoxin [Rhodobacterales]|uniref:type II toxin-antitoxin system Phd/YefM family antitoxin n=1 Tax=Rhodobacterales TaxID=204455 RepID=UPI00110844BE|nr:MULTISPECIES: type II toxin-antitoxin system Phd/YefM family antitoxin [Rhodobacterales]